jgi:hypothetical protein
MELSLVKDLMFAYEAFRGKQYAREQHARTKISAATVETGLGAVGKRWPDAGSTSEDNPVFILSAGWRTGSTFLQRIVTSADGVFIWGEPYRHSSPVQSLSGQIRAFTEEWPGDDFFVDAFEHADLTEQWIANLYPAMQDLLEAHLAYFDRLFAEPARRSGARRWGLKDVSLKVADAQYLQWLYPRAKFIFLYRNPWHAYRSYYRWRDLYRTWPDQPIFTPRKFGEMWRELTADFVDNYEKVDGLLLRYEELKNADTRQRLEQHLGVKVEDPAALQEIGNARAVKPASQWVPRLDYGLLGRKVARLAGKLGYAGP